MHDCFPCSSRDIEHPEGVASLMKQLKSQRLIKIFVGDITEPYLVSETTLVNASDYFDKALKNEASLGPRELGTLRFPEDGEFREAWEILLFWLMTKRLPRCLSIQDGGDPHPESNEPWIRTWVLADKYLMYELQDTVMLEMIVYFDGTFLANSSHQAPMVNEMLRISPVGSPLRRLLAEETIRSIYEEEKFTTEDLIGSDGVTGLTGSLLNAYHDFMKHNKTFVRNHRGDPEAQHEAWLEYLTGHLPMIHWLGRYVEAG